MAEDTICAIATAPGEAGIGIIRISGGRAFDILSKVFFPASSHAPADRELCYGYIKDPSGALVDEAMAVRLPAPHTYTREDIAEVDCHGGRETLGKTLALIIGQGARLAEPGEFTKRAFLNGRIDLSQAEAVMDVVSARTSAALDAALDQLRGRFSSEIAELREKVTDLLVGIDVAIDYPDEDAEEISREGLCAGLLAVRDSIESLLRSANSGRILREGLKVAICGRPNVGKSSLLNALLREDRSIVTPIPGTTRDTIEEYADIAGVPVVLVDTAGIRDTADEVERMGIERARRALDRADLAIMIVDGSEPLTDEDREIRDLLDPARTLILVNKADKEPAAEEAEIRAFAGERAWLRSSMKDLAFMPELHKAIAERAGLADAHAGTVVTNARHAEMLGRAKAACDSALRAAGSGEAPEIVELDVNEVYQDLGFITGDSVREDVLNEIFSRFCLGK